MTHNENEVDSISKVKMSSTICVKQKLGQPSPHMVRNIDSSEYLFRRYKI